jgi:hypothetical protein
MGRGTQARVTARVVLLSFAVLAGALAADVYSPPTSADFLKGIRNYPFVADAARRAKIRAGVSQLTRCAPAERVRKLMGDPDFGYIAYKAGTNGRVPEMNIWHYILEKKTRSETERSPDVVIWFDKGLKLKAVKVDGARDIEGPMISRAQECS